MCSSRSIARVISLLRFLRRPPCVRSFRLGAVASRVPDLSPSPRLTRISALCAHLASFAALIVLPPHPPPRARPARLIPPAPPTRLDSPSLRLVLLFALSDALLSRAESLLAFLMLQRLRSRPAPLDRGSCLARFRACALFSPLSYVMSRFVSFCTRCVVRCVVPALSPALLRARPVFCGVVAVRCACHFPAPPRALSTMCPVVSRSRRHPMCRLRPARTFARRASIASLDTTRMNRIGRERYLARARTRSRARKRRPRDRHLRCLYPRAPSTRDTRRPFDIDWLSLWLDAGKSGLGA